MKTDLLAPSSLPKLGLTRNEAAKALGISAVTVDRLTKRGLLCPSRATRRPIYSVKELERFLQQTTVADYSPTSLR